MGNTLKVLLHPTGEEALPIEYSVSSQANRDVLRNVMAIAKEQQDHLKTARGSHLIAERHIGGKLTLVSLGGLVTNFTFAKVDIDASSSRQPVVSLLSRNGTLQFRALSESEINALSAVDTDRLSIPAPFKRPFGSLGLGAVFFGTPPVAQMQGSHA
jgi:hypothetical protein